ncbi:septum formation initiator [Corynebacterium sp. zg912]|uniref:Septum formation initiator n=1 Tax=Corynebacterium wankanglinii TaxID=2735136 RepID=A0A7V9A0W5_9CORY|nr:MULTISPECIES: amino acid permease [Corynebacterium]MBA1836589.1 septum formation initiator [Corynebacterium wankanglinii]MCR5928588.1 septum formation initiator [Corynebacterium sp. zg912]
MTDGQLPEQHSEEHLKLSRAEFDRDNLSDADIEQIKEQREGKEPDGSFMRWVITLFGTGVGAGILFLPINAGSFGFWPLVIATLLIGPMVFFSHRTYARIVSASPVKGMDVLQVITALTGRKRGFASAVLYWLGIYPTVLIYAISITNTLDSFIVNQMGGAQVSRLVLAVVAVGIMTLAYALGKRVTLWLASALVYPLIIALAAVSLYLIPSWDVAGFRSYESSYPVWQGLLLILPVLVFSFSHMAALSQFALDTQKKMDGDVSATEREVSKVELVTAILLVTFTMFFVWSCALSLGADGMDAAREQNVPVLSYLANETDKPFMAWMSPIIAIAAIITSYFGHLLGTEEGTAYLLRGIAPNFASRFSTTSLRWAITIFVLVTAVIAAVLNPSILDMISVVGGIFVAFLVYIMPVLLFHKATAFKHYARRPDTIFVFVVGLVIMAVTVWDMVAG